MATIGSIEQYDPSSGDWEVYQERLEMFLDANAVAEGQRVATLLTVIGGTAYKIVQNLVAPASPKDKTYTELMDALSAHFSPKPLVIAERYRFHKRDQLPGESIVTFVAELRRFARHCNFGTNLDDCLRDRLVCGLSNSHIIKKLLAEKDLDLPKAIQLATASETASRDAMELGKTSVPASVHKLAPTTSRRSSMISQSRAPARTPSPAVTEECFRCGRTGHRPQDCLCSDMECYACGKKGHISRACPPKKSDGAKKTRATHAVEETSEDDDVFALHNCATAETHKIKSSRTEPIWIHPKVNGCQLQMELDTGSALTILPASMFHEHFDLPLQQTSTMLKPYAGDRLRPKGVFRAHACYYGQEFEADAYVVDSDGPALFGRDWLQNIVFDWRSLHNIKVNAMSAPLSDGTRRRLDALRSRYAAVFGSDRGHLQSSREHLTLRDGAQPKFLKARPLPYALRDRVGLELDRLEQDGILTKVSHSDWATPVVPIPKKDGSVRICGDFKVTVNPQLKVDRYPLPRIDDIFASLGGGEHFSKIDLWSAYLQMEMDDESKTLLTLNTHKGLYRLNRLAFGFASAPAMWQRVMDQLLSGIPKTQCIIDDIIVTGETDDEHLRNLEMVLQRLLDAGLHAHPAKTRFFDAKTEYCGHAVSAVGLHQLPAKVDAIRDAPQPTNVSQLRSFLGLVNYYARFLPNLSTTLHPLNRLLQHNTSWHWTDDCTAAFDEVKRQIGSDLVLTHFHPDLPLHVASDASPYGLGAVLSHSMPDGTERPITARLTRKP